MDKYLNRAYFRGDRRSEVYYGNKRFVCFTFIQKQTIIMSIVFFLIKLVFYFSQYNI